MRKNRNTHYLGFLRGMCLDVEDRAQETCERCSLSTAVSAVWCKPGCNEDN